MPTGQDGRWRPGTREDQRREVTALPEDLGVRLLRWSSPVCAVLLWAAVLYARSRGGAWLEDGLIVFMLLAALWTIVAVMFWWPRLRRSPRASGMPASRDTPGPDRLR